MKTWVLAIAVGLIPALILGSVVIHGIGYYTPILEIDHATDQETNEGMQASYEEVSVTHGQLKLTMKISSIKEGQTLDVTLELTNVGEKPISITATSGQIFDFIVYKDEEEVYRWSSDKVFIQIVMEETLQPGQSIIRTLSSEPITFTEGSYTIVGVAKVMCRPPYEHPLPDLDREKAFTFIQTPPLQFEVSFT